MLQWPGRLPEDDDRSLLRPGKRTGGATLRPVASHYAHRVARAGRDGRYLCRLES